MEVKFKEESQVLDRSRFLVDLNRVDLLETKDVPKELHELFLKKRRPLVNQVKDFRRSQRSKAAWRRNRYSMLKGIRTWSKSLRAKKFHRQLGRFLATRITKNDEALLLEIPDTLKALSSLRTHIYIESAYYRSLEDDVDHFELLEYTIPLLNSLELKLLNEECDQISYDELEIAFRLVDTSEVQSALSSLINEEHLSEKYENLDVSEDLTYGITVKYCKILEQQSTIDKLLSEMEISECPN